MNKTIFSTGIIFGVLAVMLGAFGAHGLESLIEADAIGTFETGVRYQMYHAFLLLIFANTGFIDERDKKTVFYLITLGVILFSFSIYLLATNDLTGIDFKKIAVLTPVGGVLLISGWILIGIRSFKKRN
ncbi:MAG: DUF423 domain-containing protein [Maribacter sp.]|nr:DUF423 domain-containing protein [Maribacter sp.]